jgi:regulator of PEP synthase PpsR (kinase-PPPase family)
MGSYKRKVQVFIISDSTGTTAEMVMRAALVQFKEIKPTLKRYPYIKTREQIDSILKKVQERRGIVFYYLVTR